MGKESLFHRLLKWLGLIKTYEISKEQMVEMCRRACFHGVCPNDCERCAWGRWKEVNDEREGVEKC